MAPRPQPGMPDPFAPLSAKPATAAELAALRRRQAASFAGSHHRGQHPHGKRIAAPAQTRPQPRRKTEGQGNGGNGNG